MLLMALLAVFSVGMIYLVQSEARLSGMDMEGTQAHYGASAALEKMVVDLNALYAGPQEPTVATIQALGGMAPSLPGGVTFSQYSLTVPNTGGMADVEVRSISGGPNHGLMADIIPVTLSVVAAGPGGEVAEMTREVEISRIPVFQFGVFSDGDLSYFPSADFPFQGRVHTNGNLFLANGFVPGLVFHSRITAAGEVIRTELANGLLTASESLEQPIRIPTAPNGCEGSLPACRDLASNEGSMTGGPASSDNPTWTSHSESTYQGMILNGDTGAKPLRLPFVNSSTDPIELIRRPPAGGEDMASTLSRSRLYNLAQIRVLISDSAADLPGAGGKVQLANVSPYFDGFSFGFQNTAFADVFIFPQFVPQIDGYPLVQARQTDGSYVAVTEEWLDLGIARENPDAILKFQAMKDTDGDGSPNTLPNIFTLPGRTNYYPLNLYDTREGEVRDLVPDDTECAVGGIMNIVELDVDNLRRWLVDGTGTGPLVESVSQNGYLLYFSDRRGMLPNGDGDMVGYGYEDLINPAVEAGTPNGTLEAAEDVNQNGVFDTYGAGNLGDGFGMANGNPTLRVNCVNDARIKRVSGTRHVLKLVNGAQGNLPTPGFTVGSENPVYVQGDYNASAGFGGSHAAAAIIADAVTFLSNAWGSPFVGTGDANSFLFPHIPNSRSATTTWYRVAVAAGKNIPWANPAWSSDVDDGMDGGVRHLFRSLEEWPAGQSFNYNGSLASLFYSQYAVGVYKCGSTVFDIVDQDDLNYSFDTDFLNPANLPPGTPRVQDIVVLGTRRLFSSN